MLKFTDTNGIAHIIDLDKFVHVHVRDVSMKIVSPQAVNNTEYKNVILTLHLVGPHTIPVTVDEETAESVLWELENHNAVEY